MKRETVDSSNLASLGYDGENEILGVEFNHGEVYHYYDVRVNVWQDFKAAPAKGQYRYLRV